MLRRALPSLFAAAAMTVALFGAAPSMAQQPLPPVTAQDRILGRADAPVTVIEYASFTCNHCADWYLNVMPAFKARFIDTGKVRLVFRDLPTPPADIAAAAAGLARCAAPERFFDVASALMHGQEALFEDQDTAAWFRRGINASGRTEAQIETCLREPQTLQRIQASITEAQAAGVTGTPTFFVNGRKVDDTSLAGLTAAINPLIGAAPATRR